jgi:hypothetical protein
MPMMRTGRGRRIELRRRLRSRTPTHALQVGKMRRTGPRRQPAGSRSPTLDASIVTIAGPRRVLATQRDCQLASLAGHSLVSVAMVRRATEPASPVVALRSPPLPTPEWSFVADAVAGGALARLGRGCAGKAAVIRARGTGARIELRETPQGRRTALRYW